MSRSFPLMTCVACAAALFAEETPVAVSEAYETSLDTVVYGSHSVKSVEVPVEIYGFKGAVITAKNLGSGETETVVNDASAAGFLDWTPSSGGVWELVNRQDGTAKFTVRYSLFDDVGQGSGTAADPVKIVDNAEVNDLVAGGSMADGTAFSFVDGLVTIGDMVLPGGYSVSSLGGGVYVIETSSGGRVYGSSAVASTLYTEGSGPNRRIRVPATRHISYSGDNWLGSGDAESVLTTVSPSGTTESSTKTGTGLVSFTPQERGRWTVSLETDDYELSAFVSVLGKGSWISIR